MSGRRPRVRDLVQVRMDGGTRRTLRQLMAAIVVGTPTPFIGWLVLHSQVPAAGAAVTVGCAVLAAVRVGIEWWRWRLAQMELEEVRLLNELVDQVCDRIAASDARAREIVVQMEDLYATLRLLVNDRTMRGFRKRRRPTIIPGEQSRLAADGDPAHGANEASRVVVLDMTGSRDQQGERAGMPLSGGHSVSATWASTSAADSAWVPSTRATVRAVTTAPQESRPDGIGDEGQPSSWDGREP